ncbi:DUF1707 SHOCT-like domain-containing protein [Actinokineospora inagensis]|uniref:DUF1707 SHOCT-like domain-containing protein n=1 Tax=Actinokineospora inagensis TaxID=103730 RepID=UPI00040B423C|nr:DUF1707 domain-containing protein [Actinokineospora inagensis]
MSDENPPSELRIGDAEREDALRALGEHMSLGRLSVDEYGDRSAKITTARTQGELVALFGDLPAPKPGVPVAPAPAPVVVKPSAPAEWADRPLAQRLFAALIPLAWLGGIALLVTGMVGWPIIFLPIALTGVGGALFGEDWKHDQRGRGHGHHGRPPRPPRMGRRDYGRGWH